MTKIGLTVKEALASGWGETPRVDCGTCPVSMRCAANEKPASTEFDCCRGVAVEVQSPEEGRLLLAMDCEQHNFALAPAKSPAPKCPLCSCDIVETEERGTMTRVRWVPTVHAKFDPDARIAAWRSRWPEAVRKIRAEQERYGKRRSALRSDPTRDP